MTARLFFLLLGAFPLVAHAQVRIETGLISGTAGNNPTVRVFKGIPFAAPPTGDLRWAPPRPVTPWEGVRTATEFAPSCPQHPYTKDSLYYRPPSPASEDCLYLNVWTAAAGTDERRPVMVWIHGGALTRGSGSLPHYDGTALATKGVVVVTINYRLGALGFMAHPQLSAESEHGSSGNYGFLDQVAALRWVQRNITAFGGDPSRVTIVGESAGARSVCVLMATPLARGLFHRAIGQSGGCFGTMPTQEDAEKAGAEFAKALGADDENAIRSLRALPAQAILKQDTGARLPVSVDGWLIPNETASIFAAARHNDVPLIVGSNADEGTAFVRWPEDRSAAAYRAIVGKRFGKLSEQFLRLYPASTDIAGQVAAVDSFRDEVFGWQARTWARHVANSGSSKAYLYYFTRVPPGATAGRYGAYHAAEIPYMFNNLLPPRPWEALDRALAETMLGYWVSFATTGRPGGDGLPLWPAYDPTTGETMELGETVTVRRHVNRAELDFFDAYQQQRREGGANR